MNGRRPLVRLSALAVIATGVIASVATAAASLPVVPTYLNATVAGKSMKVRPGLIIYTGDGTGFIGGANARSRSSGIVWSSWTAGGASGTGDNQLNNCRPDCADGSFTAYPVRIQMWRPGTLRGLRVFTRMTIYYTGSRPKGDAAHYTFTDSYNGGYGWGPPDASGYCIHTHGLKPEADCKNINALP